MDQLSPLIRDNILPDQQFFKIEAGMLCQETIKVGTREQLDYRRIWR